MINNKQQKLNEFCKVGYLEPYRNELSDIFDLIDSEDCNISSRTDEFSSQHIYDNETCRIRISLQRRYDDPIEIVWTILHEFGHHCSGRAPRVRLNKEQKVIREQLAWEYAEDMLCQFPKLLERKQEFISYMQKCLSTYQTNYR